MASLLAGASVTADHVKEIKDTDLTDLRIANFINMAYLRTLPLVTPLAAHAGSSSLLEYIQLLLSAHFLSLYERTTKSEGIAGEFSVTYALEVDMGLRSTEYGQQAIALDPTGLLARDGMKKARFSVISYYQTYDSTRLFDEDLL